MLYRIIPYILHSRLRRWAQRPDFRRMPMALATEMTDLLAESLYIGPLDLGRPAPAGPAPTDDQRVTTAVAVGS
jgi:hypothetical protein